MIESIISGAIAVFKADLEIKQAFDGKRVDLTVSVRDAFLGKSFSEGMGAALLADIVIANNSEAPISIIDISIRLSPDAIAKRHIPKPLKVIGADGKGLTSTVPSGPVVFNEAVRFTHLSLLPLDINLEPHKSISGYALFIFPESASIPGPISLSLRTGNMKVIDTPIL